MTMSNQQGFLFVDAAQAKTSRQGRRNARSFVMQNARRKNPWSTSKHAAKQRKTGSPARTGEVCADCRSGQPSCAACLVLKPAAPVEDPSHQLFDPFRTSSIDITRSVSDLLGHFSLEMAPGIIAVDIWNRSTLMKSDWFGTALSNPGFMHSLLSTIALHAYVFGKGTIDAILFHRAQAIASVNAALRTSDGISDANIGAVFNLLTVEESLRLPTFELNEDHQAQLKIHENGLHRMVELRGGLMAINTNRILQAFLLWHSTAHAIASFQAPNASTLEYVNLASYPRHPSGYRPIVSRHLTDCCRDAGIDKSLHALVKSVLALIADLNVWYGDAECPLDPLDIQNFACVLECSLLLWLRENERVISPLEDALCVALLIFTVRTTEATKLQSHTHVLHHAASKRLEKALNYTMRAEWRSCPDVLLWILCIGAISAEALPGNTWFDYQTSVACAEFGVTSSESLLKRLHLCGWVSYKLDDAVCRLWNRMNVI